MFPYIGELEWRWYNGNGCIAAVFYCNWNHGFIMKKLDVFHEESQNQHELISNI